MTEQQHLTIVRNTEPDYRIKPDQWADLIQLITDQAEQLQQIQALAQRYDEAPASLMFDPKMIAYSIRKALEIDRTEDK